MKCVDCIAESEVKPEWIIKEAIQLLILDNPDKILPVCDYHADQYCHYEGELNLDIYSAQLSGVGCVAFIDRLNKIFTYHNKKYTYLLKEYDRIKKKLKEK
jgi:hypothetical protein